MHIAGLYGFKEIVTPTFEHTELFLRSAGDTSDVVTKEMYTFEDKGGRSVTLRPEGTAGAVRAAIEGGLLASALPVKLFYNSSCFRYSKPAAGRYREHFQFGCEIFGSALPEADAELISVGYDVLSHFGLTDLKLSVNSIGCPSCRSEYNGTLTDYYTAYTNTLCKDCKERITKNPMRLLDCKNDACKALAEDAPRSAEHLCGGCDGHFRSLQTLLSHMQIPFGIDSSIVRGLDYYTGPVFEFSANLGGTVLSVCGGGRYDMLVAQLGGKHTPALGFGLGIERLLAAATGAGYEFPQIRRPDLYIGILGDDAKPTALKLAKELRKRSVYAEVELTNRSMNAQFKYCDKIMPYFTVVIGSEEVKNLTASFKDKRTGETHEISLSYVSRITELVKA
jgi:histidyl-tRNA synthetase